MKTKLHLLIISFLFGSCCSLFNIEKYCPPDAEFNSDKTNINENENVQFTDHSYGEPNSWNWTFQGGTPASSSEQNPIINYSSAGTYPVSLTVRNNKGTNTETKPSFITVEAQTVCREDRFTPQARTRLCPEHTEGDREYAGNGPRVIAYAKLELANNNKEINLVIYMHQKETNNGDTECKDTWKYPKIYTAPNNWRIQSVLTDMRSDANYTDHDTGSDPPDMPSVTGGLVSRFEIVGDTDGWDVGACSNDDAYISVFFNDVRVQICEDN